ncbi:DnaD domain-containing protein [Bacillus sp. H-16]|uniref:DnaD domain-containing protein n=1 Tax=Alteribacter salitolerans TaxID=2912333 RepID=UPI0019637A24|nr:DnaD domain-containing protein [Alteribacter salitolerans]MBM7094610.1 DnaD domain-containing protein [Alteribacter salitolerans]
MTTELYLKLLKAEPVQFPAMLLEYYAKLSITEQEVMLIIHVKKFAQEGDTFPTPTALSERMTLDASETAHILRELIRKGNIEIHETRDQNGRLMEYYSLDPLYEKICKKIEEEQFFKKEEPGEDEGRIFRRFEEEFSRPLSPMELEMISMWLDEDRHQPVLIEAALRESVVSGKLNFRYIDRILFEWKKNGVRTVKEAREYGEKVRGKRTQKTTVSDHSSRDKEKRTYPSFNWLDSD